MNLMEEDLLISHKTTNEHSSVSTSFLKKAGAISLVVAAVVVFSGKSSKSTATTDNLITNNLQAATNAAIGAYNDYTTFDDQGLPEDVDGKSSYVALSDYSIVEPHRITTLNAYGDYDADSTFKWVIERSDKVNIKFKSSTDDTDTVEEVWGQSIERVFKSSGYKYDVTLVVYNKKKIETILLMKTYVCMYVRRELRALSKNDREELLSAMWIPYSVGLEAGVKLYGEEYMDILTINSMHNYWAADIECDHLHDGSGFATQHLAITIRYEAAIQAINPRVVMPYWEYTIESANIVSNHNGNFNTFFDISPVFSANWFGNFDTMQEPWSSITLAKSTLRHNPFGLMRAPWNFASDDKILRYRERCGFNTAKMLVDMEAPSTCSSFADVLAMDNFEQFQSGLMHAPHGSIHIILGGIGGACETDYKEKLSGHFTESSIARIAQLSAVSVKALWRDGYVEYTECTTETSEHCAQTCSTTDYKAMGEVLWDLYTPWGIKPIDTTSDEYLKVLGQTICETTLSIGDMYSSSATMDPLFWVMHTTTDRLMTWKRAKTYGFTDMTWSDSTCLGHSPGDNMFFDISNQVGEDDGAQVTNWDLLMLSDPQSSDYGLPYIYDSFDYSHCDTDTYPEFNQDYAPDDDTSTSDMMSPIDKLYNSHKFSFMG